METNVLTVKARAIARCLSYNNDEHEAAAKHMLLEMAHRLDALTVHAHKKSDGLLLINGVGESRFASLRERILYKVFGVLPRQI
jgi:hypothetical protein